MSKYTYTPEKQIEAYSEFTREKLFDIAEKLSVAGDNSMPDDDFVSACVKKHPDMLNNLEEACEKFDIEASNLANYISIYTILKSMEQQ